MFDKIHTEEDKRKMKNFGYYTNMWNSIREQTVCDVICWLADQAPNRNRLFRAIVAVVASVLTLVLESRPLVRRA